MEISMQFGQSGGVISCLSTKNSVHCKCYSS
jgi:hypothetical protein